MALLCGWVKEISQLHNKGSSTIIADDPLFHYNISIYPSVPCTRIRCPSFISFVAFSTPTTAGKPYSRAITAPCVMSPPTSVTNPFIETNNGVQPGP